VLGEALDQCDQLVASVALPPSEMDQPPGGGVACAVFWSARDRYAAAAAEVEQPLAAEQAKCAQDRVAVDIEHGREVARGRQPLARARLPVGDRAADLGSDLFMERHWVVPVDRDDLAFWHSAMHTSFIVARLLLPVPLRSPPPAPQRPAADPEALIEEARRRQRRRRLLVACLVLVAALIGGTTAVVLWQAGERSTVRFGRSSPVLGASAALFPRQPGALALAADGGLYIADDGRDQILELLPSGRFKLVAGNGKRGFSEDGGRAVAAELNDPDGMAVAGDGSLYFADTANNRIRKVSPQGLITTVAGNGKGGWARDGLPALSAPLLSPDAVAIARDGRLYIAASGSNEVLRLGPDGRLTRVAGVRRYAGVYGIGRPATRASADGADGLAFDSAGNLYLAGFNTKTLLMIDRRGRMRLPDGMSGFYPRGFGGLVTTPDGRVVAISTQDIVELTPRGPKAIYTFTGRKAAGITGFLPAGVAVSANGVIYTDTGYGNGWSSGSAIVAITPAKHVHTLWRKSR
jgi:sugar lactone lactonase YvrE